MSASVKLRLLESKLSSLKAQHQHLLQTREKEIASLLTSLELTALEDNTLLGGLLFLKEKIITQDPIVEGWREAGDRFLRRKRNPSSRGSSGKTIPSKGATSSSPTPQLGSKLLQSRKEQDAKTAELAS